MYSRPGIVHGLHRCGRHAGEAVLASDTRHLQASQHESDWLGHGIYFWEAHPERGPEPAHAAREQHPITGEKNRFPYVVGAIIELGNCLNLLGHAGLREMRTAHHMLQCAAAAEGRQLPAKKFADHSGAYLVRALDCAVLEYLHKLRIEANLPAYDSVIGALWERSGLTGETGLADQNQMHICIRNQACIRGYFRVRALAGAHVSTADQPG